MSQVWGAHAARVLASASRDRELFSVHKAHCFDRSSRKDRFGAPLKPAREPRALPRHRTIFDLECGDMSPL